jgi:hypothetical protein
MDRDLSFSPRGTRAHANRGSDIVRRLRAAAEAGDARSQFNLGVFYGNDLDDNNHAVPGNRGAAIRWLLKAAQQGLPQAQCKLGELYSDGPDAPKDDVRAWIWLTLAAKASTGANRRKAESGYARIALRMSAAQIALATRVARNWAPRPQAVPASGNIEN